MGTQTIKKLVKVPDYATTAAVAFPTALVAPACVPPREVQTQAVSVRRLDAGVDWQILLVDAVRSAFALAAPAVADVMSEPPSDVAVASYEDWERIPTIRILGDSEGYFSYSETDPEVWS